MNVLVFNFKRSTLNLVSITSFIGNTMKDENEVETFCPQTRKQWRQWLQKNHAKKQAVLVLCYKKKALAENGVTITRSDMVDEALCFGWIDSVVRPVDDEKFIQYYSKRKPKSIWSKVNKEKIRKLIKEDLMAPAGLKSIEVAKENGSWTIFDEVEELIIPQDLEKKFKTKQGSKAFFLSLSRSVQKLHLQKLVLAKRPETREKRILEIMELLK